MKRSPPFPARFLLALAAPALLAGCGDSESPGPSAPDLLSRPDLADESAPRDTFEPRAVDDRGVAIGPDAAAFDVHPDVHIVTWPYKTTNLKHVKATTDYTDGRGRHWYHITSGWFKTRYYFNPVTMETENYEGELVLPIAD